MTPRVRLCSLSDFSSSIPLLPYPAARWIHDGKLRALKGTPCRRARIEGGSTANATRYQFGQLNDPHLRGAKRVICSVISAAAVSSPYRALPPCPPLPLCHPATNQPFPMRNPTGDGVATPLVSIGPVKPCYMYAQLALHSHIVLAAIVSRRCCCGVPAAGISRLE